MFRPPLIGPSPGHLQHRWIICLLQPDLGTEYNLLSLDAVKIGALILFVVAVAHTFSVKAFDRMADRRTPHEGVWRLLSEVEIVFGFWATILIIYLALVTGPAESLQYLESRNFTEPMFVFVIMVVAASRPILYFARKMVEWVSGCMPFSLSISTYIVTLSLVPLLGSLITEPAAMTLAALLLRKNFYSAKPSIRLQYATIGVLFVNVSIGGTLTPFAAPPILMVASKWGWDLPFMLTHFGWRSAIAVFVNAVGAAWLFRRELRGIAIRDDESDTKVPAGLVILHMLFLLGIVFFAHNVTIFMALFLLFMGIASAYSHHQEKLMLREALMVGFFLAGLVVLGGKQQWWLQELIAGVSPTVAYYGTAVLTAVTDNAALTYLGSLVEGLSEEFKYSLVAGAVTGGGLTVIANAPNPAGYSILKGSFDSESISALGLLVAAIPPTVVTVLAFKLL